MKDWRALDADRIHIMNKHYTEGRDGSTIDKVVIHINAGNLTTADCFRVWQDRPASAHYQVEEDGTIGQLVWDANTAWHSGDYDVNTSSIGIEHANNTFAPTWGVNDKVLDNGAHLVAAVCHRFSLGRPQWGVNVFGHSDFYATACPGALAGGQHSAYMQRAVYWYDQMAAGKGGSTAPTSQPSTRESYEAFVNRLADEVIAGKHGNGDARVRALGQHYSAVQNRVNEKLNVAVSPRPTFDVEAAAQAVIRGEYGNGEERQRRLGAWYGAVQARVNEILL